MSDLIRVMWIRKRHYYNYEICGARYLVELKYYFRGENKTKLKNVSHSFMKSYN